jgi:hypothetical protein
MRKLISWFLAISAVLLTSANSSHAQAQSGGSFTAKVMRASGGARYSVSGQPWQTLKTGDVLAPGTLIQTAKTKATIEIQLGQGTGADSNIIRLFDDTALEIKKLATQAGGLEGTEEIELDLRAGQVLGVVKKFKEGSSYQVMLPAGAAGVRGDAADSRGTAYVLRSTGSLVVLAGKMAIAIASDNTVAQVVSAEQVFDPVTGQVAKLAGDAPERKLWR